MIEKGAFVKDSIIMHDSVVRRGAGIERSIIDKEVVVGENAVIGRGSAGEANRRFPDQVYSGLTVVGKNASIPEGARIGTNCIIYPAVNGEDFPSLDLKDGETVERRE